MNQMERCVKVRSMTFPAAPVDVPAVLVAVGVCPEALGVDVGPLAPLLDRPVTMGTTPLTKLVELKVVELEVAFALAVLEHELGPTVWLRKEARERRAWTFPDGWFPGAAS